MLILHLFSVSLINLIILLTVLVIGVITIAVVCTLVMLGHQYSRYIG